MLTCELADVVREYRDKAWAEYVLRNGYDPANNNNAWPLVEPLGARVGVGPWSLPNAFFAKKAVDEMLWTVGPGVRRPLVGPTLIDTLSAMLSPLELLWHPGGREAWGTIRCVGDKYAVEVTEWDPVGIATLLLQGS